MDKKTLIALRNVFDETFDFILDTTTEDDGSNPLDENFYIGVDELARLFHLQPKTILNWVYKGKIPKDCGVRVGGRRLFIRSRLFEYFKSQGYLPHREYH